MENLRSQAEAYQRYLEREERSDATRSQYRRDIVGFLSFLGSRALSKDAAIEYKQELQRNHRPTSVNTKLAALNGFFVFLGKGDLRLKLLKIQRRSYSSVERELSKAEYLRLVRTAERQDDVRLSLLLQTICGTGIRVSELRYITEEAVRRGEAHIRAKGKNRTILLPQKLRKSLGKYTRREGIASGPVFVTRTGRPLDRSNVWKMMKALCHAAGVAEGKVFPHNLRHLFARTFYALDKDISKLADILGHSNINTTRIYIITTGQEHRRCLDALGLVI